MARKAPPPEGRDRADGSLRPRLQRRIPAPRMELSVYIYLGLLAAVAVLRIFELRISKRHQTQMAARGAVRVKDPYFFWMAGFHTLVLFGAAAEVVFLGRKLVPALAVPMLILFLA